MHGNADSTAGELEGQVQSTFYARLTYAYRIPPVPTGGGFFHARNVTLAELELELGRERQADTVARREYI